MADDEFEEQMEDYNCANRQSHKRYKGVSNLSSIKSAFRFNRCPYIAVPKFAYLGTLENEYKRR